MEALYRTAMRLHREGRMAEAMDAYEKILHDAPTHPGALYYLGAAHLEAGRPRQAVLFFERAFETVRQRGADAHYAFALALHMCGQRQEAVPHYRQALALDPDFAEARNNLAVILRELGRVEEAVAAMERAVATDDPQQMMNLANLRVDEGRYDEAEVLYRRALAAAPDNFSLLNNLGGLLATRQRGEEALFLLDRAAGMNSNSADLWYNRGRALFNLHRVDEASAAFARAIEIEPGYFKAYGAWASIEEGRHNLERAAELAGKAIAMAPNHPDNVASHAVIAKYYRRKKQLDRALAELEKVDLTHVTPGASRQYHFERGAVQDALKRYDEAFEAYRKGNELALVVGGEKYRYDEAGNQNLAQQLMQFFTRERVQAMGRLSPVVSPGQPTPIFVVGFPRSGTTLTEQILGSHPGITPGDELPYLGDIAHRCSGMLRSELRYPECLTDVARPENHEAFQKFRRYYLERAAKAGLPAEGKHLFTDKMPLNEWHLGLVRLIFPDSPVIHVVRHPLDSCLSSYFIDMTHGRYGSYKLETVAFHYVLSYRLAEHYRRNLGLRFLRLRYEDLVNDFENNVRRLLETVGVPFDERCLDFHESKRVSRTASYAQVTQKLYTSSLYRYRNYRKHIEPMIPVLEPVIRELGYSVDD
jgi:tetratricopeptide (TPR) repeat protein